MERNNSWVPSLLMSIQCLTALLFLFFSQRWLPVDLQEVFRQIPHAFLATLSLVDSFQKRAGYVYLNDAITYSLQQNAFWLWIIGTLLVGGAAAWLVQVSLTGIQPWWRYCIGIGVTGTIFCLAWWVPKPPQTQLVVVIVGYLLSHFLGWWVAVGYRQISQRATDARTVRARLTFAKKFSPEKYFNPKRGVFMGLGEDGRATYIPVTDAHKHLQLLGETRNGKTVAATVLLAQCALLKETVIVVDPKADKHAGKVLRRAAERAKVPFIYVDLRADQPPQLSVLSGTTVVDREELLISCFDLASKGTDADVYRVEDRAAARFLARSGARSFTEMVTIGSKEEIVSNARKFWEDLQELASHPVLQTQEGFRLEDWVGKPCVIYITGSTRHDNTVRLQKLVLLRLLQLIDRYGAAEDARWTALFIDEFKYLLSPSALRALGTIGDRNCHLLIAHQSLGDLRDVTGLDPEAVYGAAVVNTGLKLFYKTNDPDTAKWGADLSGEIPVYTESITKSPGTVNSLGSYSERGTQLFDYTTLLAFPPLTGMLYGSGVAKLVCVHYLEKSDESPAPTAARPEDIDQAEEGPI